LGGSATAKSRIRSIFPRSERLGVLRWSGDVVAFPSREERGDAGSVFGGAFKQEQVPAAPDDLSRARGMSRLRMRPLITGTIGSSSPASTRVGWRSRHSQGRPRVRRGFAGAGRVQGDGLQAVGVERAFDGSR
jgi:hypothetical protein